MASLFARTFGRDKALSLLCIFPSEKVVEGISNLDVRYVAFWYSVLVEALR